MFVVLRVKVFSSQETFSLIQISDSKSALTGTKLQKNRHSLWWEYKLVQLFQREILPHRSNNEKYMNSLSQKFQFEKFC